MNRAPYEGLIVRAVDQQSSALPLCYGCPIYFEGIKRIMWDILHITVQKQVIVSWVRYVSLLFKQLLFYYIYQMHLSSDVDCKCNTNTIINLKALRNDWIIVYTKSIRWKWLDIQHGWNKFSWLASVVLERYMENYLFLYYICITAWKPIVCIMNNLLTHT